MLIEASDQDNAALAWLVQLVMALRSDEVLSYCQKAGIPVVCPDGLRGLEP